MMGSKEDYSTSILREIKSEIDELQQAYTQHRDIDVLVDHLYKIAWRAGELIPGVRFKIRDVICERDWDYLEYLKVALSDTSKINIIVSDVAIIEDLQKFGLKLGIILDQKLLDRDHHNDPIFETSIPRIYVLASQYLDRLYLRKIYDTLAIIQSPQFNIDDKFHRKAVLRALEILGEYSKKLSYDTKAKFPGVPWDNAINEGGTLGLFRNTTEHPTSLQKEKIDELSDSPNHTALIQNVMRDLQEFHDRVANYLNNLPLTPCDFNNIIDLYNHLDGLKKGKAPASKGSIAAPAQKIVISNLSEVAKIFTVYLSRGGNQNNKFLPLFKDTSTKQEILKLLGDEAFKVVLDKEMRTRQDKDSIVAASLLNKRDKLFLKVIKNKHPQIQKIFRKESVDDVRELKNELREFLVLTEQEIEEVFENLVPNITISPVALINQYREGINGDKINELINIIEKKLKVSSFYEFRNKLEDIVPDSPYKIQKVEQLFSQLSGCIEVMSYTEKAIKEINELIYIVETAVRNQAIGDYRELLNPNSIYYLAIQLILEQIGMVAKDSRRADAGIEFKSVSVPETISPRRMLLLRIFRDGIAHYPERIDDSMAEIFFRDLVAFTKSDIEDRQKDINHGKGIWLCKLEQPEYAQEVSLDKLEQEAPVVFTTAKDFGFKDSLRVIGRIIGSKLGVRVGLDIIVEYGDGIDINPIRLLELELFLGLFFNTHVRVHTLDTLRSRIGYEFSAGYFELLKQESRQLVDIVREFEFRKQFQKGNVLSVTLPDGREINSNAPGFTEEAVTRAFKMTFLPNEEETRAHNESSRKVREEQLKDPKVLDIIKKKAIYLTKCINGKLATLKNNNLGKLFLELIKLDKELDELIDQYFDNNRDSIKGFFERKNRGSQTTEYSIKNNFKNYIKRYLDEDFPINKSEFQRIKSKEREKFSKMKEVINALKAPSTGVDDWRVDDWIFEDMTREFKASTDRNLLIVLYPRNKRRKGKQYHIDNFPYNKPESHCEVSQFSSPHFSLYNAYVIFRDLKLYFDDLDGHEIVNAFITQYSNTGQLNNIIMGVQEALKRRFMDLDDFAVSLNNRRSGGYTYSKSSFYDEVMDKATINEQAEARLFSDPFEQIKAGGHELITSLVDYECLNKISQLKANTVRSVSRNMHEIPHITIEVLHTLQGSTCDKTMLLKPVASVVLDPTITDLDEVARIFKLNERDKARYPGGINGYEKDKHSFKTYREFKYRLESIQRIILHSEFLKIKIQEMVAELGYPSLDEGSRHVLMTEIHRNNALIEFLKEQIDSNAEALINTPFFKEKLKEWFGKRIKHALISDDNNITRLKNIILDLITEGLLHNKKLTINGAGLAALIDNTVKDRSIIIDKEQQRKARSNLRTQAVLDAEKKYKAEDGTRVVARLTHIQTIADGNCVFNAIALGLLFHRSKGIDLFTAHNGFRRTFAEVFHIDPEAFDQADFSNLIDALTSFDVNISHPIIKNIISKLRNVGDVREGLEQDQLSQQITLLRNTVINGNAYENGNIKPEYYNIGIRCLAERGGLFQLAMAIALRKYCVLHNGQDVIFTQNIDGVSVVTTEKLTTNNRFGYYAGTIELGFLAHIFGITVREKQGEFGAWLEHGNGAQVIEVFATAPGRNDCHYELLLSPKNKFLSGHLVMDESSMLGIVTKGDGAPYIMAHFLKFLEERSINTKDILLGRMLSRGQQMQLVDTMSHWSENCLGQLQNWISGKQMDRAELLHSIISFKDVVATSIDKFVLPYLDIDFRNRLVVTMSSTFSIHASQLKAQLPALGNIALPRIAWVEQIEQEQQAENGVRL